MGFKPATLELKVECYTTLSCYVIITHRALCCIWPSIDRECSVDHLYEYYFPETSYQLFYCKTNLYKGGGLHNKAKLGPISKLTFIGKSFMATCEWSFGERPFFLHFQCYLYMHEIEVLDVNLLDY